MMISSNNKEKGENKRKFTLNEKFMNNKTNDILYAYLRSISTTKPTGNKEEQWQEYLPKPLYTKDKRIIADLCNCSIRALERHYNKLIDTGLIKEQTEKDTTIILFPLCYKDKYSLIDKELLKYLVFTRNKQCIKIYLYLLHQYNCREQYNCGSYNFTIQEIKKVLGYSETTKSCDDIIKSILQSLHNENIIRFTTYYQKQEDNKPPKPIMILNYVARSKKEISKEFN